MDKTGNVAAVQRQLGHKTAPTPSSNARIGHAPSVVVKELTVLCDIGDSLPVSMISQ